MGSQWTQLLILLLAIGAPAISWAIGKLREQHELKKARDAAKRRQEEALRTTQLTDRSETASLSPEERRERERRELAARRQAQLRELRQRQYQRGQAPGGVVVRGPGAGGPQAPTRPAQPQQRQPGPLRPGVPSGRAGGGRGPMPARPTPGRPPGRAAGRPAPTAPARRATMAPIPVRERPEERRREERKEAPRAVIKRTEIGTGRAAEAIRGRRGVGGDVREMLMRPDGRPRERSHLARAFALTEVLGKPISMRSVNELPWSR